MMYTSQENPMQFSSIDILVVITSFMWFMHWGVGIIEITLKHLF